MNVRNLFFIIFSLFIIIPSYLNAQYKVKKVVVDAGHGGRDPGAIGFISKEKDINLAVALRLGKMIQDSTKGQIQVIYTRTTDVYPENKARHALANKEGADLFISIHVNATAPRKEIIKTGTKKVKYYVGKGKKRKAQYKNQPVYKTIYHKETQTSGTETYVLGLHRMDQKEKAIANFGEVIEGEKTGLLDLSDPTTAIIINQYNQRFLSKSVNLASKIQGNFKAQGRRDLGVKQLGLEVLAGSAMPGVLVELGFINNREEEQYLNTAKGVEESAHAIFKALMEYAKQ